MAQSSSPDPSKRNRVFLLATVFIGFFIFGFSENVKGPAIPRIQADFSLDERQLGTLLSLNALGYLLACSFTAWLVRRVGLRRACLLCFGTMVVSGVMIFFSHSYASFAGSYFFMYVGNGLLEIALAILAARIFLTNTGAMMNLAHFFYGLSSTVAPLLASGLMSVSIGGYLLDWRGMYMVMLSLAVIPMIPAMRGKFPEEPSHHGERVPIARLLRDPVVWLLTLMLTFGVVSELGIGAWLVNFLEKAYGWGTLRASGLLSVFFLVFTLARLFIGPITDRIGFTLSLILLSVFSGICSLLGLALGERFAWLLAVAGIGIAPIYPTIMAYIAKKYPRDSDAVITVTVMIMGLGSVAGNWVIGAVAKAVRLAYAGGGTEHATMRGLQAGYAFIGLCAVFCAAFGIWLYATTRKRGELL